MNQVENVGLVFLGNTLRLLKELPDCIMLLWEIIADEEVEQDARLIALGAIIYVVSPWDMIPDILPGIGYVDDVIVLRIALEVITRHAHGSTTKYRKKYDEIFSHLSEDLIILKCTLGRVYTWLRGKVEVFGQIRYRGKTSEQILNSLHLKENLCEASMVIVANYHQDEKRFLQEVKSVEKLLPFFERSMEEDRLL
jgi:uncharacterized membrane protein YkvA (DUF1232 family)